MFKNIFNGFKVFSKKQEFLYAVLAYICFAVYNFLYIDFLNKFILQLKLIDTPIINYTSYIFNLYGIQFIWFLLLTFIFLFLTTFIIFLVSQIENKQKNSFSNIFSKVLKYTFLEFFVMILFTIIFMILGLHVNLITIILMILFVISIIFIIFIFFIGNIYLGLEKITVKKALEKSKNFIINNFWSTILFFILIYIVYFITYFIVDLIYTELFFINEVIANIFGEIYLLFISLYVIYTLTLFIKYKK